MTAIWTIIAAVLIFCVLIFVHELGHFMAAKFLGIRVHEFAIGMGPKLLSKRKGETLYSIRALPIGGFCALEGEDEASADEKALSNKPAWVKLIVMAAGAFMNLFLGLLLLFCLFGTAKIVTVPQVAVVQEGSPAYAAGLEPGDRILEFSGRHIFTLNDLSWELNKLSFGDATEVVVRRNGEKIPLQITFPESGELRLGIGLAQQENTPWLIIKNGFFTTGFYSRVIIESVIDLFRGEVSITSMSGPVGIVSEIGTAVEETAEKGWDGFLNLINLAVLLTVNLGIFNLLPIPALDGGRIFFLLVSVLIRKPIPPEKEGVVHLVGFALLILLSIVIAYFDVIKLFA